MMGHNSNWNLDLHFKNGIGSGFIFCAYSFAKEYFEKVKVSGYPIEKVVPLSLIDFQFYGKKESGDLSTGNFLSYDFHPANVEREETSVYLVNCIVEAVRYQEKMGLTKIIIPNYYENDKLLELVGIIKTVNRWLCNAKKPGREYYMTIPITNHMVINDIQMESLLNELTDMNICFDGYYIACETKPEARRKVSTEMKYFRNLSRFLKIIKQQDFKIIYAYANWDALIFYSQIDIDYISVASFENLRNFSLKRFVTSVDSGGPSDGWYFSEKLLNVVKAQYITLLRSEGLLDLIANEKNIFSDAILKDGYIWSNMKAEVHKNYMVAVASLFSELSLFPAGKPRIKELVARIDEATRMYSAINSRLRLNDESSNYHLGSWKLFLESLP